MKFEGGIFKQRMSMRVIRDAVEILHFVFEQKDIVIVEALE